MRLSLGTEHQSVLAWTALITDAASAAPAVRRVVDHGVDGALPAGVLAIHLLVAAVCVLVLRRRNPYRESLQ